MRALAALAVLLLLSVSLSGCVGGRSTVDIDGDTTDEEDTSVPDTVEDQTEPPPEPEGDLAGECLGSHQNLAQHIHPYLTLSINGTSYGIPQDLGIDTEVCPGGMHVAHTHDNTSKLHIETHDPVDVSVDVFFRIWGMPFDSTRLDRYHVNETHELVMEVDGVVSDEWGDHVFHDGEQIEIIYRERA
tara:strand:+ start:67 stop:627 length:561 start_codon:yes stop_codon:yes gene_type:complete